MKREVFPSNSDHPIWIEGKPQSKDSQILVTVSNQTGEHTALISHDSIVSSKAKLFVEAPIERIVTGADIWKRRILSWLKVGGYVLACVLMLFSALSFTGVVKARIVLTASMSPAIDPGDIILTASPDRLEPKIGSVVAYTAKRSHRIIGGDANTGFIVKGDANPSPDVQKPLIPDINGVIFLVIPFIGRLLTREALFILVPCIFGFWLVIDALKNES